MCSIARDTTNSVAAATPTSTLLGSTNVGSNVAAGARRVIGGASRTTYLTGGGTGSPGSVGGSGSVSGGGGSSAGRSPVAMY